ncbi:HlyC/CorC family transporter [Bacillus cytotoxicus]|uniref:hemolysin family protein n=1 Tax=unclassified Bacillus cereus group TaxID=2750818 RepID=UPI001F581BAF|nr:MULTISPECIES: hemolysin family protein [unclassified Bacillus cereus group]EMA6342060.1 HlyC/CorC family transporter [Bacillus cytotoxicus]
MNSFSLVLIFVLILISGFFVATEFAIVKVRKSRIDELTHKGHKQAPAAQAVLSHLDVYLSTCQFGITLTSLGIGWLGEPTLEQILYPVFQLFSFSEKISHSISFVIAFILITFFHVVLGELVPKSFAIQRAENITLLFAKPLIIFHRLIQPFIWILNKSASFLVKGLGMNVTKEHDGAHSEEELRLIVNQSYESGEINDTEYTYVNNVFKFDNQLVQQIMIPRNEMVCLSLENTEEENRKIIRDSQHTRYPIIQNNKDHILGIVHLKEIFKQEYNGDKKPIQTYIQPPIPVFERMPIQQALFRLQQEKTQMAIVIDEYGGTAGLITMEDILEELVGEIHDEFDQKETPMILECADGLTSFDGKVLISEVNNKLGTSISYYGVDTIGGWILSQTVELPIQPGYTIEEEGFYFKVLKMDENQIKRVVAIQAHIPVEL